jgi:Resolvase, N terminal domain
VRDLSNPEIASRRGASRSLAYWPGLRQALVACRAGDTLVVTKLDRLARSLPDAAPRPGPPRRSARGGSASDSGSRGLTGYSIVSADSLDAAVELAKGCPVLEIGGAVDVYEAIAM